MWSQKSSQLRLKSSTSDVSERLKVARDLHDTVSQELAALGYVCDEAISLSSMGANRDSLVTIRSRLSLISLILRDELGLLRNQTESLDFALTQLFTELKNLYPISMEHTFTLDSRVVIDSEIELEIYRTLRELVINILQHSQARTMSIHGSGTDAGWSFTILDDGICNDAFIEANSTSYHYGIAGIHERIEKMHGDISYSRVDETNRYEIRIPQ